MGNTWEKLPHKSRVLDTGRAQGNLYW